MVANEDELPGGVSSARSAGRVRQHDGVATGGDRRPDSEHHLVERVTFVEVHSSRQDQGGAAQVRREQAPGVTFDAGERPAGNLGIGHLDGVRETFGVLAQPGTEHDGHIVVLPAGQEADRRRCFGYCLIVHPRTSSST